MPEGRKAEWRRPRSRRSLRNCAAPDHVARVPPHATPGRTRTKDRLRVVSARSARSRDTPSPDCRTKTSFSAATEADRPIPPTCCRQSRARPRRTEHEPQTAGHVGSTGPGVPPRTGHRQHMRWRSRRSPTASATCARDCWETVVTDRHQKTFGVGSVVRDTGTGESLRQQQRASDRHVLERRSLGHRSIPTLLCDRNAVPTQVIKLAKGEQDDGRATEQED